MKRLKWLVAIAILLCSCLQIQAQDVIYSPYDNFDVHNGDFSVVGMTGGRIYTYRATKDGYYLDAYDDSMNKQATVVLDFFPAQIYQTRFITYNDQVIVLYQAVEGNKVIQYAALLDGTGRLKKGPIKLDEAKTGLLGPTKTYFSSVVSEDKKYILVYSATDRGSSLNFDGKWIDDQLNIVKRSHAAYKADQGVSHGEPNIANNGDLYFPVYTPTGSKGYADQYWLISLHPGDNKFEAKELALDNMYATNVFMKIDNTKNRLYFGGFYSDRKNGDYMGVLYAYYDIAGGSFQNKKEIPFDNELLAESGARSKKRAFNDYQVRQLIVKNDGGFVLISESFFITTRNNYTPGFGYYSWYNSPYMASMVREYHYNDIMTLSYNGEGTREWSAFIPKEQYSVEDGGLFSSYALMNTGGSLAFMFNDFNVSQSRIQLGILDNSGQLTLHSFSAEGNNYPDWLPHAGKQVAGKVMVIPCLRKKQICFAKVVL